MMNWIHFARIILLFCGACAGAPLSRAAIRLETVAAPGVARSGETLDVSITVANDGVFDRTDLLLSFTMPGSFQSLSESLFDGNCVGSTCEPGEEVQFEIATLPAGTGISFSLPLQLGPSITEGATITMDVSVFDDGVLEVSDNASITVDNNRELELALSRDLDPAGPGQKLTYTLTYGVIATSPGSPEATLSFPIPAGVTFGSATDGGVFSEGTVLWQLGNLNPGTTGERTVTVTIDPDAVPGAIIAADARFEDNASPINAVVYGTATRIGNGGPLALDIMAGPNPVRPGETMDIELTVSNTGSTDRNDVVLSLEIPDHLVSLSEGLFEGNCIGSSCETQEKAFFAIGTLPAGRGLTFSLPVSIAQSTPDGTVVNLEAEIVDSTGELRKSSVAFAVDARRTLELALVEDRDPTGPGELLTYTLTYGVMETSSGSPEASLHFPIPEGTAFVSTDHGGVLADDGVTWSLGNLNPGESGERTVTVRTDAGLGAGKLLRAEAVFEDRVTGKNIVWYPATTRIRDSVPFALNISAGPDPVRPGETMDIELTLTNTSGLDRTDVLLRLEFPDHLESLSEGLFNGNCTGSTCEPQETAFFELGTIPAGKGVSFSMPGRVSASALDGTVITLEADLLDGSGERLETGASFSVNGGRELELALSGDRDPVMPGENITFTLTYGVIATSSGAPGASLRFPIPSGTRLVSAGRGSLVEGVVSWPLGNLNPGQSGERTIIVQVDPDTPFGVILSATATFEDSAARVKTLTSATATRVQERVPLELRVTVSPDPAHAGEILNAALRVANTGAFDRTGVVIWLEFPDYLDSLSEGLFSGNCTGSTCEPRERAFFEVDTIPAGKSLVFTIPIQVGASVRSGTVIALEAEATDVTGDLRKTATSFAVSQGRLFDLTVHAEAEPVPSGGEMTYILGYGVFQETAGSPSSTLSLTLPQGVSVLSADKCAEICRGMVKWPISGLNPGSGGERFVTVGVGPDWTPGTILAVDAAMTDTASNQTRAQTATRIENDLPLTLDLSLTPDPVLPGDPLTAELFVTNNEPFDRGGIVMTLAFPDHLNSLSESETDGNCTGSSCETREPMVFEIGTLAPGQTVSFPLTPTVGSGVSTGTRIDFIATVTDNTGYIGSTEKSVLVGSFAVQDPVCETGSIALLYPWISNRTGAFESVLIANNFGDRDVTVQLTAFRSQSENETVCRDIPARGFLEENASSLFPGLGSGGGYAVLLEASSVNIRGSWVTNSLAAPSGQSPSQGVAVRVPRGEDETNSRAGKEVVFGYLPLIGNVISAPVVVNIGAGNADVTLRFFNQDGTEVGSQTQSLAPFVPFAALANNLVAADAGDVYMTAESDNVLTGVSFVFDSNFREPAIGNVNRIDTSGADSGPKTLFYPWVSNRSGLFESILVANNYGNEPVTVALTASRGNGTTSLPAERTIPARGFLRTLASELFPDLGDGSGYNVMLVSPSSKVNGQWVTNNLAALSGGSPSQGVAIDVSGGDPERMGRSLLFGYLPVTGSFTSAPVVVNAGSAPANVVLRFYDTNGHLVAQDSETLSNLSPGLPFASLANVLIPGSSGNVYLVATSDGEPITGVTFVFNGTFNEPAIGNATAIDFNP